MKSVGYTDEVLFPKTRKAEDVLLWFFGSRTSIPEKSRSVGTGRQFQYLLVTFSSFPYIQ